MAKNKKKLKFLKNFIPISIIKLYQFFLSPILGNNCRFIPTCSNYAIILINKHGFMFALPHILKRLSKCHPYGPSGYDPVPEKKKNEYRKPKTNKR